MKQELDRFYETGQKRTLLQIILSITGLVSLCLAALAFFFYGVPIPLSESGKALWIACAGIILPNLISYIVFPPHKI